MFWNCFHLKAPIQYHYCLHLNLIIILLPDSPFNFLSGFSSIFANFYYFGFNSLYYTVSCVHKLYLFYLNCLITNKLDFKGTHKESQNLSLTKTYSAAFSHDAELTSKK